MSDYTDNGWVTVQGMKHGLSERFARGNAIVTLGITGPEPDALLVVSRVEGTIFHHLATHPQRAINLARKEYVAQVRLVPGAERTFKSRELVRA
jgi:hypothetical protein